MIKRFIDDHAIEKIDTIKKPHSDLANQMIRDTDLLEKLNTLGWLARSVELVSPYLVSDIIRSFKQLVSQPDSKPLRDKYIRAVHGSQSVKITVHRLFQIVKQERIEDPNDKVM